MASDARIYRNGTDCQMPKCYRINKLFHNADCHCSSGVTGCIRAKNPNWPYLDNTVCPDQVSQPANYSQCLAGRRYDPNAELIATECASKNYDPPDSASKGAIVFSLVLPFLFAFI